MFKYLFRGKVRQQKGWIFLNSSHFTTKYFPYGWGKLCDMHRQGLQVCYPVKMRGFISWFPKTFFMGKGRNLQEAPGAYTYTLSFEFVKVSGNLE